jgi:predicted nucleic acid-binding protein
MDLESRMRVVISDSSALIDLAKVQLMEGTLALPYEFVIPDVMFADELLDLKHYQRGQLLELGFRVGSLDSEGTGKALQYGSSYKSLSVYDCFALAMAESIEQAILLTGDGHLRKVAQQHQVETHGIIWLCEQMRQHQTVAGKVLRVALAALHDDPRCRVPRRELNWLIEELKVE